MDELTLRRECGDVVIATLGRRTSVVQAKNGSLWSVCTGLIHLKMTWQSLLDVRKLFMLNGIRCV